MVYIALSPRASVQYTPYNPSCPCYNYYLFHPSFQMHALLIDTLKSLAVTNGVSLIPNSTMVPVNVHACTLLIDTLRSS